MNHKKNHISKMFIHRIEIFDKRFLALDVLEKRIRLCNDTKKEYFHTMSNPLLNRPYSGQTNFFFFFLIPKNFVKNCMEIVGVKKIHGILLAKNYQISWHPSY